MDTTVGKDHYRLLDPIVRYPQTTRALSFFKSYLDQLNLPIDCPVQGTTTLLDLYIINSVVTGDFLPLHQYLHLGANPEYTLSDITPMNFAQELLSVDENRAYFAVFLLQFYTEKNIKQRSKYDNA